MPPQPRLLNLNPPHRGPYPTAVPPTGNDEWGMINETFGLVKAFGLPVLRSTTAEGGRLSFRALLAPENPMVASQ